MGEGGLIKPRALMQVPIRVCECADRADPPSPHTMWMNICWILLPISKDPLIVERDTRKQLELPTIPEGILLRLGMDFRKDLAGLLPVRSSRHWLGTRTE